MTFAARTLGGLTSFTPTTVSFTTNGTFADQAVPTGATTAVIEVFGASGDGGSSNGIAGCNFREGGGGGSGAYAKTTLNVSALNGKTFNIVIAARNTASNTTVSVGTTNPVTGFTQMVAPYGGNGGNATATPAYGGPGAAGTIATGGTDLNQTGNAGLGGSNLCTPGAPGAGKTGTNGNGGAGGQGGTNTSNSTRTNGVDGRVYIRYT